MLAIQDFIGILRVFMPASIALFWLYLFCHFGDQTTERFGNIVDHFYQIEWYKLPLNEQKYLPLAIAVTQAGVYLRCFGSISCTHDTFKKV